MKNSFERAGSRRNSQLHANFINILLLSIFMACPPVLGDGAKSIVEENTSTYNNLFELAHDQIPQISRDLFFSQYSWSLIKERFPNAVLKNDRGEAFFDNKKIEWTLDEKKQVQRITVYLATEDAHKNKKNQNTRSKIENRIFKDFKSKIRPEDLISVSSDSRSLDIEAGSASFAVFLPVSNFEPLSIVKIEMRVGKGLK